MQREDNSIYYKQSKLLVRNDYLLGHIPTVGIFQPWIISINVFEHG